MREDKASRDGASLMCDSELPTTLWLSASTLSVVVGSSEGCLSSTGKWMRCRYSAASPGTSAGLAMARGVVVESSGWENTVQQCPVTGGFALDPFSYPLQTPPVTTCPPFQTRIHLCNE